MAERRVEVVACDGSRLRVRLLGTACGDCDGCGGRCTLFATDDAGELTLPQPPTRPLRTGQHARLVLDDARLRAAAWRGYGVAWLGLLLGASGGRAVAWLAAPTHADVITFAGLLSGTFLAVAFSKRHVAEPQLVATGDDSSTFLPLTENPPP